MNNENTFCDFQSVRSQILQDGNQMCEGEFSLPEYAGDISSIISYDITPKILSKKQIANKIDLECILEIRVYCLNTDNELFTYEYKYDFINSIEGINEGDIVSVNVACDQTVLRQSAERKIYFKAEPDFYIEIYSNRLLKTLLSCEEPTVKYKKNDYTVFSEYNLYEKNEVYNDIVGLNKPKNDVKTVLRKNTVAFVGDCKIISKKALIKGEIKNDFIYIDVQNNIQKLRTILPFSYVVDINEEETDDIKYFTRCDILSTEITPNIDDDNTFSSYSIKIKLNLYLSICGKTNAILISDLYSTVYDTETEKENIEIITSKDFYKENITIKKDFELPQDVTNIYDAWFSVDSIKCVDAQDGIKALGSINLKYLYSTKDEVYSIAEEKTEFEYNNGDANTTNIDCNAIFVPLECEFSIKGNKLSVKFEGEIIINNCFKQTVSVVTNSNVLEKNENNQSQIIVYYPEENEDLWEIAKRFKADYDEIATNGDDDRSNASSLIIQR